ncbi:PmbA protein [Dysgonomonadaceae bacterium PH5-43]|nr:PmbA protein [Dysgonomonadaceae bacterium PH5-43]
MISQEYKKLANWALDYALSNGCSQARVVVYSGVDNSFEYRDSQLDKLEQSSEAGMSICVYVDDRYSSFSTNRLDKEELKNFIKQGIESTHYLAIDKYRTLPPVERQYKGRKEDLELYDKALEKISVDDKLRILKESVNEVYGKDKRLISVSAAYSDGTSESYMVDSNGFEGENATTYYNLSAETSMQDKDDARPSSYWYDASIFWNKLEKKGITQQAYERTLRKLGQTKINSGAYKMLVDNLTVSRLLSPIISSLYGSSIQQKNSFLIDKLGEKIMSEKITIVDSPHIKQTRGARWFDGEGVATKRRTVIDSGVLSTYYLDTYYAAKLSMEPTIQSPSILVMSKGEKSFEELIKSIDKGIWVTGFNGGNSNSTTGDFSLGVEGFLVEKGNVTTPINEMNITGNLLTLWQNIEEIGNDPRVNSPVQIPSILFNNVSFNGK